MGFLRFIKPKGLPPMWDELPAYRREEEIDGLTDIEILSWIARNDKEIPVRLKAIKKLDIGDSTELFIKLKRDKEKDIRAAAREKLNLDPRYKEKMARLTDSVCQKCEKKRKGKKGKFYIGQWIPEKTSEEVLHMGAVTKVYTSHVYNILGSREGLICNSCVRKRVFSILGGILLLLISGVILMYSGGDRLSDKTWNFTNVLGLGFAGSSLLIIWVWLIKENRFRIFQQSRDKLLIRQLELDLEDELDVSLHFFTRKEYGQLNREK